MNDKSRIVGEAMISRRTWLTSVCGLVAGIAVLPYVGIKRLIVGRRVYRADDNLNIHEWMRLMRRENIKNGPYDRIVVSPRMFAAINKFLIETNESLGMDIIPYCGKVLFQRIPVVSS